MIRFGSVLVIAASVLALPMPAGADTGDHCSFRLVPVSQVGTTTTAALELVGCYATFEQAIEGGAGGSVDLPAGTTPESLTQQDLTAASDVLIGTEWDGANYLLGSVSYWAPSTCSSTQTWQLNYVGDSYNDRFESGKGFGGCDVNKKFQHADYAGSVLTCRPNCTSYGTLANQVSSLRWKP
jgi:hypothetical protein